MQGGGAQAQQGEPSASPLCCASVPSHTRTIYGARSFRLATQNQWEGRGLLGTLLPGKGEQGGGEPEGALTPMSTGRCSG